MRGELGGVEGDPGAGTAGDGDEAIERPVLAGDIGGTVEDDEAGAAQMRGLLQAGPEQRLGIRNGGRDRQADRVSRRPRKQRRVVLGLEDLLSFYFLLTLPYKPLSLHARLPDHNSNIDYRAYLRKQNSEPCLTQTRYSQVQ